MMDSSWSSRWAAGGPPPLAAGPDAARIPAAQPLRAPHPQRDQRRAAGGLWHEPAAQAQIALGVEGAPLGQHRGRVQQSRHRGVAGAPIARGTAAPGITTGGAADPRRDRGHVIAAGQVGAGVAPGQVTLAERGQLPGRVEHLGHGGVGRVEVADRVGEHGRDPGLAGQPQHPGRAVGASAGAVVGDLDDHLTVLPPPG
jgi:hypothetical protein